MYEFNNTERNNNKASDFETKSLLYLIGFKNDKTQISLIAIDCFNDVTGMDESATRLWDVQSKGEKSLTPRKIGKYLYTLYDNFVSNFDFYDYIFFMPELERRYLNEGVKNVFTINDFNKTNFARVKEGLLAELARLEKTYCNKQIDSFLQLVSFVEDRNKKSEYIKKALSFKNSLSKEELFYETIFNEIRDIQTGKKNSYIEGERISKPSDVMRFNRHMRKADIHMLIVNRYVGVDLFNSTMMPFSFIGEVRDFESEDLADLILDCKSNISRAFFNKNAKNEFWSVFEGIIRMLNENNGLPIRKVLDGIDPKVLSNLSYLDTNSVLFLIALIKDGLKNDNK